MSGALVQQGGRGVTYISGGLVAHCYTFPRRPKPKASDTVIRGIVLFCHQPASV